MALFTGIDTSDNINAVANGRTMTEKRFWATEEWMRKGYLRFLDEIGDELEGRGHTQPWQGLLEDTATEDWRVYWRRRADIVKKYAIIWMAELGNDLARHEFETRVRQKIEAAGGGADTDAVVSIAMLEYDDYEKSKDQEMLGGSDG